MKLSKSKGYSNFIITNQSGIAKGKISLEEYNVAKEKILSDFNKNEIIMAHNAGCKGILVLTGAGRGSLNEFRSTWSNYEADFIAEYVLEAIKN